MSTPIRRHHHLLSQFHPFDQLDDAQKASISEWKDAYKEYDEELRACLNDLAVPELEPYLVWIPYMNLTYFKQFAQGGFAKVFDATITVYRIQHHVAAKELKR